MSSLRRPGGNITGIIVHSGLNEKIVEMMREALPTARRLAVLVHDADPFSKNVLDSIMFGAQRVKVEPLIVRISRAENLDSAFKEIIERKADALYLPSLAFFTSHRKQLVERALKARLPLLSTNIDITAVGGLLSYGTQTEENWRRAAALVNKILRGAKPGELPVEQPERFELAVNMKTAKTIGVIISPTTMLRATRVIE